IRLQSWRHLRPRLLAGATGDLQRLGNEYIYDMRRNEDINLSARWQESRFVLRTIQPAPSTGPAGHPDSRPNITLVVGPDSITRSELFTAGAESASELRFVRSQ